eukprot:5043788-Pleurochrysis_carterae.AAC.1
MRVFEYAGRGLTANARQPNGSMGMMRGFSAVSDPKEDVVPRGGPIVRFSTSTAWETAKVQNPTGAPQATRLERVSSIILRMARSATPMSWWTCGGHVVACTPSRASKSVNC